MSVETEETIAEREARISRNSDGEAIGISVFVSADELDTMGIDVESLTVDYRLINGGIKLD